MEVNEEKIWYILQLFFDKGENESQVAEIDNGVYGSDTVMANYLSSIPFNTKLDSKRCLGVTPVNTKSVMDQISICKTLAKRSEIYLFLKRMVTGGEKASHITASYKNDHGQSAEKQLKRWSDQEVVWSIPQHGFKDWENTFRIWSGNVKYERIKFLVIALKESVEIYAWAPKPYHKFMAFKSFSDLLHKPLLVDLTVEENIRLKVIFGSADGFHAVDLDSGAVYDVYLPTHSQGNITPHAIVTLPNSKGMQLLLCYDNEGIYVNTFGKVSKNIVLQWGEMPTSVAFIGTGQVMGWGNKAIEIRNVETGHLDGVFMHKKAQRLKFLCERNEKVFFSSAKGGSACQIYFMTLSKPGMNNW
ncbi:hypothetical protein TNCV_4163281 [Trichonephila clavipes]|nr:hypothetical protein TNCV_4163281 [Trichonephila clavipes]